MSVFDDYAKAIKKVNTMSEDKKIGGINLGYAPPPPTERDPDSVEQLLAQVLTQSFEIREALGTMRYQFLGSWPEASDAVVSSSEKAQGLIPNMKEALYKMIETHRAVREHIAAISKGVR